jgi:hypothetical protein
MVLLETSAPQHNFSDNFWLMWAVLIVVIGWLFKEFFYKGNNVQRLKDGDDKFINHEERILVLEKEFPEVKNESYMTRKTLEMHQNEQEKALLKLEASVTKMIDNQTKIGQDISVIKYALDIKDKK